MKRLLATLFAIAMLVPALISAQKVKVGDVAIVPQWTWVKVLNTKPIANGNYTYKFGENCAIKQGALVMVLSAYKNSVIVLYSIRQTQYGTPCPSGVTFLLKKAEFAQMTARYQKELETKNPQGVLRVETRR